jgi:hypothetical protein
MMNRLSRRHLLGAIPLAAMGKGTFYRIGTVKGRQCFVDPAGRPFFSIGMNHIDSAPLRSDDTWHREFGNDAQRWLKTVRADLLAWGFNSVGWVQEFVSISAQHHRHSRSFTPEEYRWLSMPYGHMLPFIESHQWEIETRLPKIDSPGFAEWCDYVARDQCVRYREDSQLIGYFYSDCPVWVHTKADNAWRGALFDAKDLATGKGRAELERLATHYYRTLHQAIRRYDPNHLILGDRYEARAPLPEEVVRAALPFVDVLSFQCFSPPAEMRATLERWAKLSRKPVLLADAAHWAKPYNATWPPPEDRQHDAVQYAEALSGLLDLPSCVGYHLCGAYLKNNTRRYGFRDAHNRLEPYVAAMARANQGALARFRKAVS